MVYLSTCWMFAAVRWWHTCREPKERRAYIWPDRKLQVLVYMLSVVLVPYVVNPNSDAAWMLMKSYFPATYFFYCGLLMLCFAGTVKQWAQWKNISWVASLLVMATMLPLVINAWLPLRIMSDVGLRFWQHVVTAESIVMMAYCGLAIWQVARWILEARDANYSNPDDFPVDYARRVWVMPFVLIPLLWPAYVLDSRVVMAAEHILLAIFNVVLLITVMPAWRRAIILSGSDEYDDENRLSTQQENSIEEQLDLVVLEIKAYVEDQAAYLNPHLKIDDVSDHSRRGRTYVSLACQRRFGSFANYINGLRLAHYDQYVTDHPNETKESAAQASGFSSYNAYYRARLKFKPAATS